MMWNKDKFVVSSPRKLYFRGSIQIFREFFVVCVGSTKSTKISTPRKLPTVRYLGFRFILFGFVGRSEDVFLNEPFITLRGVNDGK